MPRPRPAPSAETRPFWEALAGRELKLRWCPGCSRFHHPQALLCPRCLGAIEWRTVSGAVELRSWTVVERPFTPGFEPPYAVAQVAPVEAPDVLLDTMLSPADAAVLAIEAAGKLVCVDDPNGWTVHVFQPERTDR